MSSNGSKGYCLSNGVAIVGIAGRFPGAKTPAQFWRNLCEGQESISHFSDAELDDWFDDAVRGAPNYVKARPILDDVDQFDAGFFGMYAKEAELTDPQHRVFLECAWEALEDGGYDPAKYRGAIGVYAGCSMNTYFLNNICAERHTIEEFTSGYQLGYYPMLVGASPDFLATRVSYKFDLRGPSVNVQSACSTSLLAVAQACQSLLLYQSDMALAGAVSITFPQQRGYLHQEGGMASADGSCRTFDASASGTVFGSGAGIVLLKRLEDALADGDQIYAVIRGCGVNNDGAAKVGFTAPSVDGQAAAIEMALAAAGVDARSIGYVECHGTATPLGDPIEVAGLTKAFSAETTDRQFCALGSVKTNIGHLDVAAGVAGLIKTALSLKHRLLPPSLHYRQPNPQIDFAATPFYVNAALTQWPDQSTPRRAGVSAFGVGGTNVHVVLEEAPPAATPAADVAEAGPQLLVLSAKDGKALDAVRANLAQHLREHPELDLADVAHSLQTGRRAFEQRGFLVCRDRDEALAKLAGGAQDPLVAGGVLAKDAPVAFMFPGQGAQYPDMGRGLYEGEPVFRQELDRCADILRPLLGSDLRDFLYPAADVEHAHERLLSTALAQPAIFTIEYALAQLWLSRGIRPQAMIGHSIGEFVAATLAGVFTLEDALGLVAERGRLMQELPGGAMLAVRLPEREVIALLTSELALAAVNAPSLCVVSGPHDAVAALEQSLTAREVISRRLHTSHAFHSQMVDPIIEPLRERIRHLRLSVPALPYVSCVTGDWIRPEQACSPDYWARHVREPVRFADGIATLTAAARLLLEVGPGNTLATLARQTAKGGDIRTIASLPDASREVPDRECALAALGRLWLGGAELDWAALHPVPRARVSLPTYPFQRSRHWIAQPKFRSAGAPGASAASAERQTAGELPRDHTAMNADSLPTVTPQLPADDRLEQSHAAVVAVLEHLSGSQLPQAGPATTFLEMGFDSLFLSQVAQRLQSQLKTKITFRQLLGELSTVAALAAFLADKLPKPAAAKPTAPAAAAPLAAPTGIVPAAMAAAPLAQAAAEGIFREQLQAITQLLNRQLETMQSLGLKTTTAPAAATAAVSAAAPLVEDEQRPSRFQVYKPGQKSTGSGMTPAQQRHIETLVTRYAAKTAGSKRLTQTYRPVLADPRAAAGFRAEWKEMVYPLVCVRAAGSKIWDIDGNEYIDLVNGYGQTAFGHTPAFVVDAVKEQLDKGFAIGPQADLAGKVAALFAELTGNERITFCNTGSEAVMAALRVARAVTGRNKVVVFNGAYHGQFDEVLVKGVKRAGAAPRPAPVATGIPESAVENMIVLDYGAQSSLQWIQENAAELAAVVVEPVQSRHPGLQPFEFLRKLRDITEASGTAFVMDEVVTGFRVHPGGMQAVTGIRADLATYGKVVGGGLPIGILAGKASFMDALDGGMWNYGDESFPEAAVTFFAGTFVRHPLALAAAWAVLNHLKNQGPALQETLAQRTAQLVTSLNGLFEQYGLTARIENYSSLFYFSLATEHPLAGLFFCHLRERGIHIQDGFPCFLTTAHSDQDIQSIVDAFRDSLAQLHAVDILGAQQESVDAALEATAAAAAPLIAPLTENQIEIWLSAQLGDEASCAFNESITLHLHGRLNEVALRQALDQVVMRHDALRTSFSATGEELRIAPQGSLAMATTDASEQPPELANATLQALVEQDARTPFDLVHGPLLRAQLVHMPHQSHALVFTAHHIICDGWSVNVIISEFADLYAALCRGQTADLPQPLPFSVYTRQQEQRDPVEQAKVEAYWLRQFEQKVTPLELPTDRPRSALRSFRGSSRCHRIEAGLYHALKKAGARQGCTLFVSLLAAFQVLAGRLAGHDEVVVGVPTAGQSLLEDQILVGHCVNFLPIRARWTAETSVSEHLATVAKSVLDAYEHQSYTLGTLVRKLALRRETNRLPLTEIQFNLERLADRLKLPDLEIEITPNAKAFVNFDLFLNVIESDEGLRIDCDYNTDLFDAATIDRWLTCYQALLEAFVADPAQRLVAAPMQPAASLQQLLVATNQTAMVYPQQSCIQELIAAQAAARPAATAAMCDGEVLSYAALEQRANRLAHHLRSRIGGSAPAGDALVGVRVRRSLDMLVALLATLKAGCAYVPLDPAHPPARLRHILDDAKVAALITDGYGGSELVPEGSAVIDLEADAASIATAPDSAPAPTAGAGSLAYVIYTSGSTGLPKGVEITHRSVVNLLTAMAQRPGLTQKDILLAVTTISFDIAALELFLPLTLGATVVIAAGEEPGDGFKLAQRIESTAATAMQATPATWRLLLEAGFAPRPGFKMLVGGETLPRELANQLLKGGGELWNMYGPTETTIWSSCARITAGDDPITVGEPIANTRFYVLDRHDQPVPPGVPGQLHIGGDGVASGYHRRPELTAEKFIPDPFASGRLYRTGDSARHLPGGGYQILGRMDHQIKLRGFRIELGEIEAVLMQKAQLPAAAVLLREDLPGQPQLVAYFVERLGASRPPAQLRALLAEDLPDYMIPAIWVPLAAMPLLPNGKLDRSALPQPDAAATTVAEFVAPQTATERALADIWSEVLQRDRIGTTDDIFGLGADSIHLFQITARATRHGLRLTARQLIRHRTIAELASELDSLGMSTAVNEMPPRMPPLRQLKKAAL